MDSHHLIDAHLAALASRLPAQVVEELADGLHETWHHHVGRGMTPTRAAHAAIAEFGSPAEITDAFVAHSSGRANARVLLATGPVVGATWGISLITARAWTWPVHPWVAVAGAITLLTVVAFLLTAATARHDYRRTRLGNVGAAGLITLDIGMVAMVLLTTAAWVWPMAIAIAASVARTGVTLSRVRRLGG